MSIQYRYNRYKRLFFKVPRQIMQIDIFRNFFCFFRWIFLKKNIKILPGTSDNAQIYKDTIKFNLLGAKELDGERTHQLIRPLLSVEKIIRTIDKQKILSIGPRTEAEIFNLWGYGFHLKNIKGLDLFSYSKYIEIGDMHDI